MRCSQPLTPASAPTMTSTMVAGTGRDKTATPPSRASNQSASHQPMRAVPVQLSRIGSASSVIGSAASRPRLVTTAT